MMTYAAASAIVCSPFVGSFLGCIADRLPFKRPLIYGRSSCDACGHPLGLGDLVPLASWFVLGGRCGHCQSRVSLYYPLVEFVALVATISAVATLSGIVLWVSLFLASGLLTLAAMDARHLVLADSIMLALAASGLFVAIGLSQLPLLDHLIGLLVGFLSLAAINHLYRWLRGRDGLGNGDPKLLAAGGAWLGWQALPSVILWAILFAFPVVLGLRLSGWRLSADLKLPFGTFLCAGIWLTWLLGPISFGASP